MPHFGFGVEQALHYLFRLAASDNGMDTVGHAPSARDVAGFYQLSESAAAKLFTRLEKAGIVIAREGREGGFILARSLAAINVLQVADAIEGPKKLFECRDIRAQCEIFGGHPPDWATSGVCAIHAAMIKAERAMREALANVSLQEIFNTARQDIPGEFMDEGRQWFANRRQQRRVSRKYKMLQTNNLQAIDQSAIDQGAKRDD